MVSDSVQSDDPAAGTDKAAFPVVAVFAALAVVGAVAAVVWLPAGGWSGGPSALRHPAVGQKLSRLELQPLTGDGRPVNLDDLSGRVVLLNFWGTWCPPCLMELPDMAYIERKFRNRADFKFLAVSCGQDLSEDLEQLRLNTSTLLLTERIDMPTYADPGGVSRLAADKVLGLEYFPTTVILDRGGVIRGVWVGPAGSDELEDLIARLLE